MEFDPELEEGSELMTWDDAKIQCAVSYIRDASQLKLLK